MRKQVRGTGLLMLTLVLVACSSSPLDGISASSTTEGASSSAAGTAGTEPGQPATTDAVIESFVPADGEDLAAYFRSRYAGAEWVDDLQSVSFTTYLGRPVVEIRFGGTRAEIDGFGDEVLDLFYDREVEVDAFVQVWSSEGTTVASNFRSDSTPRPLPPPPASVDEVAGWIDAAYGPSSADPVDEAWVEVALGAVYEHYEEADGDRILSIDGFEMPAAPMDEPYAWHQVTLLIEALQAGGVGFGWADYLYVQGHWGEFGSGMTSSATTEAAPPRYDY